MQPRASRPSSATPARLCVALRAPVQARVRRTRRLRGSITTPKVTQTYDQNGHLATKTVTPQDLSPTGISKGLQSHINLYNAAERLVKVSDGSNTEIASYAYTPFGQRIKKTVSQNPGGTAGVTLGTTFYFYADEGLIAETDGTGNLTTSYGWNPDGMWGTAPVWKRDFLTASTTANATEHYYHVDHLGTPQRLTNAAGEVTWRGYSEAFGKTTMDTSLALVTTAVTVNNLRFPGQVEDAETGTHYNFMRDYDAATGRYIESDPIGLEGGVNMFVYVRASPVLGKDPMGLAPPAICPNPDQCVNPPVDPPPPPPDNAQSRRVERCVTEACKATGYEPGTIGNWCCKKITKWACSKPGTNFNCCDCVRQICRQEQPSELWPICEANFLLCNGTPKK